MSTRRDLDDALQAWGDEPGPAPDPAFLARLEQRLRHGDGAVEIEVDLQPTGRVVPLRRRVGIAGVAAVAVAAVATAAAALGTFAPEHGVRVDPGADPTDVTLPVGPSTSTPTVTVTVSSSTTVVAVTTATAAPAPVASTTTVADPTTTAGAVTAAEVTTRATVPPAPATTRPTIAPTSAPTTAPPVTDPPTTVPPVTTVAPTTTEVHPVTTFSVTCAYAVVDTRPAIVCEWTEPPGGAASYRILRGDQQASVGRVLSPTPGTRRYVDHDIVSGHTYTYLVHALDAGGTRTGQSNLVAVACCTA